MHVKVLASLMAIAVLAAGFAGCMDADNGKIANTAGTDVSKWNSTMKALGGDHVIVPLDPESVVAAIPMAMSGEKKVAILSNPLSKPGILSAPVKLDGTPAEIAAAAARAGWEKSDGAVLASNYKQSVIGAPLAAMLGVPMLIIDGKADVFLTLKALGVKELLCIDSKPEGVEGFASDVLPIENVNALIADVAKAKGRTLNYIALTATDDTAEDYHGVKGLSAMAAVLAAYRGGIVVQSDDFSLEAKASESQESMDASNAIGTLIQSAVKREAEMLSSKGHAPAYLALAGCPTTVAPVFMSEGGYNHAVDSYYGDLDGDNDTIELAVGRFVTIDLNDALDLFARTANYAKFVETHESPSPLSASFGEWKDVAGFIYGHGLLETAWPNTMMQTELMVRQSGGFSTMTMAGPHPDAPQMAQAIWEASNIVYLLVHGAPDGYSCTYGALMVSGDMIREWNLGPTLVYASTCLTTKLVGEKIAGSFSLNFLHAGGVCYVGANQPSSDSLVMVPGAMPANGCDRLGEIFLTHIVKDNMDVGTAFKVAKNEFLAETQNYFTWYEYVLYGDPALNPYEPNNGG